MATSRSRTLPSLRRSGLTRGGDSTAPSIPPQRGVPSRDCVGAHVELNCDRCRNRSEGEATTDHGRNVVIVEIGYAGGVRNGDGQTAAHFGIRNSGISVESLGEAVIHVEGPLVEVSPAGSA